MSVSFGRQSLAIGTTTPYVTGVGYEYVRIRNESPYDLDVNLSGQGTITVAPWQRDDIYLTRGYTGQCNIVPNLLSTASGSPSSYVVVDGFPQGELTQPMSVPLVRLANIGNSVNTVGGGSSYVQNDGNAGWTSIVESTPTGAASSTVEIDNNGNVTVKGNNAGTLTTLLQLIAGASPAVQLAAASILTEVLGGLQVDKATTLTGAVTATNASNDILASAIPASGVTAGTLINGVDLTEIYSDGGLITSNGSGDLTASSLNGPASGNLNITAGASGLIFLQYASASNAVEISSAGLTLKNGVIGLLAGQFSRMNAHRTTCGSGTTISHGLGVTPTMSVGCPDMAQAGSATVGTGNNTSTTFQATVGAGSSIGWIAGAGF